MDLTLLTDWARTNPWPAALAFGPSAAVLLLLASLAGRKIGRRLSGRLTIPVAVPAIGALLATGLSADTAWRFAAGRLGITELWERGAIFAVGEFALFSFALGARANLHDPQKGRTGIDGVMIWVTCAALAVPAWSVSDSLAAALGRLVFGPCAAAVLWHKAMGIELRHIRPTAQDEGFLATVGRDLRERFLARFGLATRDRTAAQIARDRATIKAALLAERYHAQDPKRVRLRSWTMRRLRRAQLKAGAATDEQQRDRLLTVRAHLQHAAGPRELSSPWRPTPSVGHSEQPHRTVPSTEHRPPNTGGRPAPNIGKPPSPEPTEHPAPNTPVRPRPRASTGYGTNPERPGERQDPTSVNTPWGAVPSQVSPPNTRAQAQPEEPANTPLGDHGNASPSPLPPEMTALFGARYRQHQGVGGHHSPLLPHTEPNTPRGEDALEEPSTDDDRPGEEPNTDDDRPAEEPNTDDELTRVKIVRERANGAGVRETARRLDCSVGYVSQVFKEEAKKEAKGNHKSQEAAAVG